MSLFGPKSSPNIGGPTGLGGTQNQQGQAPSLFGNNQQAQNQSGGSLFGKPASTQPSASSSLFALGTTQTASPFNLGQQQPQQQQQQQQQPTNNLFGSQQPSAPAQTGGTSLFGTQPAAQPQQAQAAGNGQSTFQPSSSQAKAAQPAYFENLLEKARKRPRDNGTDATFQDLPSIQLGLGDIAKRVRELGGADAKQRGSQTQDGKAHYLIAASGVNPGTTRRDLDSLAVPASHQKTILPTDEWDPDSHRVVEQLRQRQTDRMIQESLDRAKKSFDAFLEDNLDINWEVQRKRIYEHFGLAQPDEMDEDIGSPAVKGSFGQSRRSRADNMGAPSKSTLKRSVFGPSSMQKSVIGATRPGGGTGLAFTDGAGRSDNWSSALEDKHLREKQRKYSEKIQALNQTRLAKVQAEQTANRHIAAYPVLQEFLGIEERPGVDSMRQIPDAYKALIEITKEPEAAERSYADDYLDETPNSPKSIKIRRQVLEGSRQALEKAFFEQLEALVAKNPKEASIGGVPTAFNKVRAYIRIRTLRKDLAPDGLEMATLGQDYCWALIFYLLRCGLVKEAVQYVVSNAAHFKTIDRNIITFITAYAKNPERRLEGRLHRDCNNVYSSMTKTAPDESIDPFKIACYKIIGRCELNKRSIDYVLQGVEDWIWLQFSLAREVNKADESAGEVFGLEDIQYTIMEIGQRHFAPGADGANQFGTFFFLQILGGMFEQAVAYIYPHSYTVAVHFAIALDYYGLLRVADFSIASTELLTHNTKELPQVSFGRMIGYYTRDFRAGNVEAAADYLALICLNADLPGQLGKSQASLCHEALRELVLESREFVRLLGDIKSDGVRIKGALEKRLALLHLDSTEDFLKNVTVQAASVADDSGRIIDAVLLYHLAEDYDNVITIANRALSEAIATDISAAPPRLQSLQPKTAGANSGQNEQDRGSSLSLTSVDDPVELAQILMNLYSSKALFAEKIKPANREACSVLLRMAQAKAKVVAGEWAQAYEMISALNLLPLNAKGSIPAIRSSASSFASFPNSVARNIGPLLLWTITCIGRQRESLSQRQYEADASKQLGEQLLTAAKDLMVFAGLLKYRLGERVWEAICGIGGEVGAY